MLKVQLSILGIVMGFFVPIAGLALELELHRTVSRTVPIEISRSLSFVLSITRQIQKCKTECNFICAQSQIEQNVLAFNREIAPLSENYLQKMDKQLMQDKIGFENQLSFLLKKEQSLANDLGIEPWILRMGTAEISLPKKVTELAFWQNEIEIGRAREVIVLKGRCLECTRQRLKLLSAQKTQTFYPNLVTPRQQTDSYAQVQRLTYSSIAETSRAKSAEVPMGATAPSHFFRTATAYPYTPTVAGPSTRTATVDTNNKTSIDAGTYFPYASGARSERFFRKPWFRYTLCAIACIAMLYGGYRFKQYLNARRLAQSNALTNVRTWQALRRFFI